MKMNKIKNNLKISNMVLTGRIPIEGKISNEEANKMIQRFNWMCLNEENSPILSKRIVLREKIKFSVHGKEKQPYVSIWHSGAINIVGVLSRKEANKVYEIVINELKKIFPKKLK